MEVPQDILDALARTVARLDRALQALRRARDNATVVAGVGVLPAAVS